MITAWTKHLSDPKDKAEFANEVFGAKRVLDRLYQLMEEDEKALTKKEISTKVYDLQNWDYRMADNNGYRRALNNYKTLLTLDQKETNG